MTRAMIRARALNSMRHRQAIHQHGPDTFIAVKRPPQVAAQGLCQPVQVLDEHRAIEAILLACDLALFGGGELSQDGQGGIARNYVDDEEDEERDQQDYRDGLSDSLRDEQKHQPEGGVWGLAPFDFAPLARRYAQGERLR